MEEKTIDVYAMELFEEAIVIRNAVDLIQANKPVNEDLLERIYAAIDNANLALKHLKDNLPSS